MINLINLLGLTPFLVSIFQNRFHVYSMLILLFGILYYTNNSNESIRNIDRGLCLTLGILVILGSVYVFGNVHSSTWFYGIALLAVYAYNTIWCSSNPYLHLLVQVFAARAIYLHEAALSKY